MTTTPPEGDGDETLTSEDKREIAENRLQEVFRDTRKAWAKLDAVEEDSWVPTNVPGEGKIRSPDFITFTPKHGLHEAKYRSYARKWRGDKRIYIVKERFADYEQHATWLPVSIWVYVNSMSRWVVQHVSDLDPDGEGDITIKDDGEKKSVPVWWFSINQFLRMPASY